MPSGLRFFSLIFILEFLVFSFIFYFLPYIIKCTTTFPLHACSLIFHSRSCWFSYFHLKVYILYYYIFIYVSRFTTHDHGRTHHFTLSNNPLPFHYGHGLPSHSGTSIHAIVSASLHILHHSFLTTDPSCIPAATVALSGWDLAVHG